MTLRRGPVVVAALIAMGAAPALARAQRLPPAAPYDFNGDGRQDVTLGLPNADGRAGAIAVFEGGPGGPARRAAVITATSAGMPSSAMLAGTSLASADFDRDGRADLAVGALGGVTVIPGSDRGLRPEDATVVAPVGTTPDGTSEFGRSLVTGDVDGDDSADLVVGAPTAFPVDPLGAELGSGALYLLFGDETGLTSQPVNLGRPTPTTVFFPGILALGDVDGDRQADVLEVLGGGVTNHDGEGTAGRGFTCIGAPALQCRLLTGAESPYFGGPPGPSTVAVGDLDGDGRADVVHGEPFTSHIIDQGPPPRGRLVLWRGTQGGFPTRSGVVRQGRAGVPGTDEPGDEFGAAVAVARLDGDRRADVVVGAPGEDRASGRVTVLYSGAGGRPARERRFDVDTAGVPGRARPGSRFGAAVTALDADGDRRVDLAVRSSGAGGDPRALTVLFGARDGIRADRAQSIRLGRSASRRLRPSDWRGYVLGR